ncbi:replication initiation protein [Runella sp. MFBS21]|uniref:replication initiation protein n=1 Tax=Runella sp. MFBS21 TaxID=3034018 RepID=UPI0023F90205|nr:replication initiation protein [Runella sp. MFBS21]MDF7819926.1 replication initiation protein [Runella sp. MFBS21]
MIKLRHFNRQPNGVIMSRQNFSLLEKRVFYIVMNQITEADAELRQNKYFRIPAKLITNNYRQILAMTQSLMRNCQIWLRNDEEKEFSAYNVFSSAKYSAKEGVFEIGVSYEVLPHIAKIKSGYTEYELAIALSLNKTYSQRLYEILSRWKNFNGGAWSEISVDDLRELISATEETYDDFGQFKRRVLDPSQEEISAKTDLSFTYQIHKTGRKVTHISFIINTQESKALAELQEIREELGKMNMDDRWKYFQERLQAYDFSRLQQSKIIQNEDLANLFINADMEIQAGKRTPNNPTAYMAVILGFSESSKTKKSK